MQTRPLPALVALALLGGCGAVGVRPTGVSAPAREPDCRVEMLREPPERAYEALAEIQSHVTAVPREGALEVLRRKACELGAEAIIVERNQVLNEFGHVLVAGTAIRYKAPPAAPAPERPPAEPREPPKEPPPRSPPGAVDL